MVLWVEEPDVSTRNSPDEFELVNRDDFHSINRCNSTSRVSCSKVSCPEASLNPKEAVLKVAFFRYFLSSCMVSS